MIWLMVSAVVAPLMARKTLAEEKVVFPSGDVWTKRNSLGHNTRTPTHNQRLHRTDRTVGRGRALPTFRNWRRSTPSSTGNSTIKPKAMPTDRSSVISLKVYPQANRPWNAAVQEPCFP